MAKRIASTIIIVIGIVFFAILCLCMILLVAPGVQIFGLRYIALSTRGYHSGSIRIANELVRKGYTNFSGSIKIEADQVPVEIYFTQGYDYTFEYLENYSGFTTTKIEYPSYELSADKNGTAVIKILGFEKWVFQNSNTKRYVRLRIPMNRASAENNMSLTIVSSSSNISFHNDFTGESATAPTFNVLDFETNGNIIFNMNVVANTYALKTNNSIIVSREQIRAANAKNYDFESRNGKIEIGVSVSGDISAKTKNGDISLISCRNLNVETKFGDVKCFNKNEKILVNGDANIKTTAGDVILGKVSGTGGSIIQSTSGDIQIEKINKVDIKSQRGAIRVKSVVDADINNQMGTVFVEESVSAIDITTVYGNIVIGGKGVHMSNPTIKTQYGEIKVISATNKVNIEALYSDVEFTNLTSEDITIKSGRKVNAYNLKGVVVISANGNSEIAFAKITDNVEIVLGDNCKKLDIYATYNKYADIAYVMESKDIVRYEDNANGTGTYSKIESGKTLVRDNYGQPFVEISGKNALVNLYFAAS